MRHGVDHWFRRLFGARAEDVPGIPATATSTERLGDVPNLRLRDVGASELSPDFRRKLAEACSADSNIVGVHLGWMSSGEGGLELLAVLALEHQDGPSIAAFLERANALGGPRCVAVVSSGRTSAEPFYRRDR